MKNVELNRDIIDKIFAIVNFVRLLYDEFEEKRVGMAISKI